MGAQTMLRTNGAKAGDIAEAIGEAAEAVAKAIEVTAAPLAEMIEGKASTLAKSVEERGAPLAKSVEERAAPLAEAIETTVEALAEDLEEKIEQARKEVMAGAKNFKFGPREGLILGAAVGIFAAVWFIRKIDRKAVAEKLRAAGTRIGEQAQAMTSRVGGATHELTDKASALTGMAGERVGQVVEQIRGQNDETVEVAKLRLSDPTSPAREVTIGEAPKGDVAGSDLDKDTQTAINDVIEEVERIGNEAREEAGNLGLSNGMKVVAFDGTDIGRVQEVRKDVFVLNRPKGSDLLVPLTEVARIEGTVAYLRIDVGQVPKMGWENA